MASAELPFSYQQSSDGCDHGPGCSLNTVLPKRLQEACAEHSHLSDYLHMVPMGEIGIPDYYPTLTQALSDLEERNLIYPVGDGLFIHIYPNTAAARDYYIAVEPHLTVDLSALIPEVEDRLVDWAEEIGQQETPAEKKETILKALDRILTTNGAPFLSGT